VKFTPQFIKDVILIEPNIINDSRGYFVETFRQDLLEKTIGYKVDFKQENESKSSKGTLRGLHYQIEPFAQAKLLSVTKGRVLDVALDIRKSSPSFGDHVSIELTENNKRQLFVPKGFAHGFVVLSESAILTYKVDNYYAPKYDRGIAFDDKKLKIDWQFSVEELQFSDKDKTHPSLTNAIDLFD
jgi:dTDP-4-dehydrorhamnose 3,5-epimerase